MPLSDISFISPKAKALRKLIKVYYIHQADEANFHQKIVYYPNFTTTLNIYKDSSISWDELSRTHTYTPNNGYLSLLVGKFNLSREINMSGPFRKVTIVFHPLGLNHFMEAPLSTIVEEHFSFFDHFGTTFNELFPQLFEQNTLEHLRNQLDAFFLSRLIGFDEDRLVQAVGSILNEEEPIQVSALAKTLEISRKTLLRLFKKHLGYSVEEYISIVRFRKALIKYQEQTKKPNFSTLAYDACYYDQSDFNRKVKMRTGLNPRQLFHSLQKLEEGLFWSLE